MNDMQQVIVPRSDQKNADDLLTGPLTIKITKVSIRPGTEQPISVFFEGDDGKPWKPCKSMARCMVAAWGPDSSKYIGRSLTLFCDPAVKWGGMAVGGIRISHMSDIADDMTMALTVTRANKKPFTVRPIRTKESAAPPAGTARESTDTLSTGEAADQSITPDQCLTLEAACNDNGIPLAKLKAAAKVERLAQIKAADYDRAMQWIEKAKAAKEVAA